MAIYQLNGIAPKLAEGAWVAESAEVMGQVVLGQNVSIWFGSILRGDSEMISIGDGSNVQDACVLHADEGVPVVIGNHVSLGHRVMLHGCHIDDGSLIGIGAVVLNRARIGKNCLVGAGSLVTEGKEFPEGSMIMGSPAKIVRPLTQEEIQGLQRIALHYVENAERFRDGLKRVI